MKLTIHRFGVLFFIGDDRLLMNKIKKIEDLIIAILLGNCEIQKNSSNTFDLGFKLEARKAQILENYLARNSIESDIFIVKASENEYVLESNLLVEKIVRDWTDGHIVTSINPKLLNINVFMLLICLFGYKGKKDCMLRTNIKYEAQLTLQYFIFEFVGVRFIPTGDYFKIRSLHNLVYKSILMNRPAYETLELMTILHKSERETIFKYRLENEEENTVYAIYK